MAGILKATLSVISSYRPNQEFTADLQVADPGEEVNGNSLVDGVIGLWDMRMWQPWSSRGLVGAGGWFDYHTRDAFMDSLQAPHYLPVRNYPKHWPPQTISKDVISTNGTTGLQQYDLCATYASPPFTYTGDWTGTLAFDPTSVASFLATLTINAYGWTSTTPDMMGEDVDVAALLDIYFASVDIRTTDRQRFIGYPHTYTVVAPGIAVGAPTDCLNPGMAVDNDSGTFAEVRETNGNAGSVIAPVSALWHPCTLVLSGWTATPIISNHSFLGVMATGHRSEASFTAA